MLSFCKLSDLLVVFLQLNLGRAHQKVYHRMVSVRVSESGPQHVVRNRWLTFPKARVGMVVGGSILMRNV